MTDHTILLNDHVPIKQTSFYQVPGLSKMVALDSLQVTTVVVGVSLGHDRIYKVF